MARIQQSIEVKMPVHAVYNQLTQFEDYPQFMEEVQSVMQVDETHLHWTAMMANRPVEWDAEISEQQQDRCIAWHNLSGPTNTGRVDVEALGDDAARVTMTLDTEPEQAPGSMAGQTAPELEQRLRMDLGRLKTFLERENLPDPQEGRGSPRNSPVPMESYGAGSEGMAGDEDPDALVNVSRQAAATRNDSATAAQDRHQDQQQGSMQATQATQSDYSLSRAPDDSGDDGRFSIAEEVNLDEQSNAMRHVGQMPQDTSIGEAGQASDAVGNAMSQGDRGANTDEAELKRKLDKNLPPPQ